MRQATKQRTHHANTAADRPWLRRCLVALPNLARRRLKVYFPKKVALFSSLPRESHAHAWCSAPWDVGHRVRHGRRPLLHILFYGARNVGNIVGGQSAKSNDLTGYNYFTGKNGTQGYVNSGNAAHTVAGLRASDAVSEYCWMLPDGLL